MAHFFSIGSVNLAAKANIYGDPEAANIVFTCGAEMVVVSTNVTTQVILTEADLCELRDSKARHGEYIYNMCQFYKDLHLRVRKS